MHTLLCQIKAIQMIRLTRMIRTTHMLMISKPIRMMRLTWSLTPLAVRLGPPQSPLSGSAVMLGLGKMAMKKRHRQLEVRGRNQGQMSCIALDCLHSHLAHTCLTQAFKVCHAATSWL